MEWTLILQTFLLTTTTSQPEGKLLILESWGALSKKCILFGFCGASPQTPEIRQSLKIPSLVQRAIEKKRWRGSRYKDKLLTKIFFSWLVIILFVCCCCFFFCFFFCLFVFFLFFFVFCFVFFLTLICAKAENKSVICGSCIVCDLVWPCVICAK